MGTEPICENISIIKRPLDQVAWISEGKFNGNGAFFFINNWNIEDSELDEFAYRHNRKANILWMDWHISTGKPNWSHLIITEE